MARDPKTEETIDRQGAMTEAVMMGLRLLREGVNVGGFSRRYEVKFESHYAEAIKRGMERGLLEWLDAKGGKRLRLTREGRFIANEAILPFF
jgi:coproporphyrinogen III oxidase-like Fe-S oxidoreductase